MGCTKTKNKKILRKIGTALIITGAVCVIILICIDTFIRPTLMTLLDYRCRTEAERIISSAVFESVSGDDDIGSVINFTFGSDGRIVALSADQAKINSLKALITEAVNSGLSRISGQTVGISLGTLTGISFLYGTGAQLVFRMEPQGKAETRLVSSFTGAGINQTIHSIILEVDAVLSPMMPGFYETVDVSYEILLSQTVIVGDVPEQYSHIVLDQGSLNDLADIHI